MPYSSGERSKKKKGSGPMALRLKQEDFSSGAYRDRVSAFDDVVAGGPLELLDQGGFGERRSCNGAQERGEMAREKGCCQEREGLSG